jgi:hypothetical protein
MPPVENVADQSVSPLLRTPMMSVEAESDMRIDPRPIRFSGFVAFFLGLMSALALLGQPMMIFPVFAIVTAMFALRPYNGVRPLGHGAAVAGLVGAIVFAVWGTAERSFRYQYMSDQATVFAADWLRLMAEGDFELACELQQPPSGRQPASMPLNQYYRESAEGKSVMGSFRENSVVADLIKAGSAVQWTLDRPPVYRTQQTKHLTDTIWRDASGNVQSLVKIGLSYQRDDNEKPAQWYVYAIDVWVDR